DVALRRRGLGRVRAVAQPVPADDARHHAVADRLRDLVHSRHRRLRHQPRGDAFEHRAEGLEVPLDQRVGRAGLDDSDRVPVLDGAADAPRAPLSLQRPAQGPRLSRRGAQRADGLVQDLVQPPAGRRRVDPRLQAYPEGDGHAGGRTLAQGNDGPAAGVHGRSLHDGMDRLRDRGGARLVAAAAYRAQLHPLLPELGAASPARRAHRTLREHLHLQEPARARAVDVHGNAPDPPSLPEHSQPPHAGGVLRAEADPRRARRRCEQALMQAAVQQLFKWMPFLFGIGFIAPLIAQTMAYWDIAAPFGMSRIAFGLLIGAPWGLYAVLRGRWV